MVPICSIASIIIISVILSRIDLGVHFLHQCIAGFIIGCALSYYYFEYISPNIIDNITTKKSLLIAAAMGLFVVCIYNGKKLFGIDSVWDVKMVNLFYYNFEI